MAAESQDGDEYVYRISRWGIWPALLVGIFFARDLLRVLPTLWRNFAAVTSRQMFFLAIWLLAILGMIQSVTRRIVVDPRAGKIFYRAFLVNRELLDFSEVGDVVPVETSTFFGGGTRYRITSWARPDDVGIPVSPILNGKELEEFAQTQLPALRKMLGLSS